MPATSPGDTVVPSALTMGEPAGIGPDVTLVAWARRADHRLAPFYAIGDAELYARRAAALGLTVPIARIAPEAAAAVFDRALPVVDIGRVIGEPGRTATEDAPIVIAAIERAVADVAAGRAGAVVTAPIHKHALYAAGFSHPGHTEFLGALAATIAPPPDGIAWRPIMMLAGPELRTVPVTVHVSLAAAAASLDAATIVATARIVAADLTRRFGIERPRLVVAGLNPHAGEDGAMGREDLEVIRPAVDQLIAEGLDIRGPLPADTLFHARARASYDAALCMYHDQALIPVKTLAFDETVNVTLGLPFVRTSPDHGTALDIAGRGIARAESLIAALAMAAAMSGAARR
ncbi:4-hydroxythreonine-4-phosphate dehydrogenase PdxA [Siculibacillus lacustris]|uniref:4-hydroxythreonine-4-phosphate dehydrogenase n=1 Tax=Siculibacillus lacustris TaxID=1549641 RepID=A0A4Q9VUF6_9HYPH|nr:4-hydroxythreonine-4-phosphate dehydrogenase PdxA [Siculibacillus lacustris]TBW39773.1 4-hydroxythreonine-4-phosphate dehydrogenase PdxA [Siculibacillus lacustris]